jgi:DNA repair protein RadC
VEHAALLRGTGCRSTPGRLSKQVLDPQGAARCSASLSELPPRERLWRLGVPALGDAGADRAVLHRDPRIARCSSCLRIWCALGSITPRAIAVAAARASRSFPASARRAARLSAAFELGRRAVETSHSRRALACAADVYRSVAPRLAGVAQELALVIGVDVRNGLVMSSRSRAAACSTSTSSRARCFAQLVQHGCGCGVLVHNHPSGDPDAERDWIAPTRRMRDAGRMIGIPIIDHGDRGGRTFRASDGGVEWHRLLNGAKLPQCDRGRDCPLKEWRSMPSGAVW